MTAFGTKTSRVQLPPGRLAPLGNSPARPRDDPDVTPVLRSQSLPDARIDSFRCARTGAVRGQTRLYGSDARGVPPECRGRRGTSAALLSRVPHLPAKPGFQGSAPVKDGTREDRLKRAMTCTDGRSSGVARGRVEPPTSRFSVGERPASFPRNNSLRDAESRQRIVYK